MPSTIQAERADIVRNKRNYDFLIQYEEYLLTPKIASNSRLPSDTLESITVHFMVHI
jgi:hypothetical protein